MKYIQNLTKFGNISYVPQTLSCRINNFWITYTKDLKTDQFYSDLSLFLLKFSPKVLKSYVSMLENHHYPFCWCCPAGGLDPDFFYCRYGSLFVFYLIPVHVFVAPEKDRGKKMPSSGSFWKDYYMFNYIPVYFLYIQVYTGCYVLISDSLIEFSNIL
mgnify:CR=1 FL=1